MSESQTHEEVFAEHQKVLGLEFGLLFNTLHNELSWLYVKWGQFKSLYSTNDARIELINACAPSYFYMIQFIHWENIILHIARLNDPPSTMGKDNLTIQRLREFVDSHTNFAEFEITLNKAVTSASFARDLRNRNIAHRDLGIALNQSVSPLATANVAGVEDALGSIKDVLSWIHKEYFDRMFMYDMASVPGGAGELLAFLREGRIAREQRLERIRNGTATQQDYDIRGAPSDQNL